MEGFAQPVGDELVIAPPFITRRATGRTNKVMAAFRNVSDLGVYGRERLDLPATATG
jgi:hypothetical protein